MNTHAQAQSSVAMIPVPLGYRRARAAMRDHRRWPSVRVCTSAVRVFGELDAQLLRDCILSVVRRHEALRSRVVESEGAPFIVISPHAYLHFELIDATSTHDTDALINEFCERQIDLLTDPLFVVGLFRLATDEHIVILALDHLIADGRSLGLLEQEIWSGYCNVVAGTLSAVPEIPVQFADYLFRCEANRSKWQEQHLPYWRNYLAGVSPLHIPRADGSHPPTALNGNLEDGQDGVMMEFVLGTQVCEAMRLYASQRRIPLSMVAFSLHSLTMGGWCKTNDFPMMFVSDGRHDWSHQNTIGFLDEHLVLRIELREDESFTELLHRLKSDLYRMLGKCGCNYVSDSIPELGIPAIEACFNWSQVNLDILRQVQRQTDGKLTLKYQVFRPPLPVGFVPIYLGMAEAIRLLVYHRPHVVSPDLVRSFVDHLNEVAVRVVSNPDLPMRNSLAAEHLNWTGGRRGG